MSPDPGTTAEPLRIGVLGAARITERALVRPAEATGARLVAVAARDRGRAETFARTHGVERVHDTYADLLADPEVEAVYNPLANSLHAPWNAAALRAGKHVLTEKPFAGNAVEAAAVRDLAAGSGLVLFEAFHYLYHPMTVRLRELLSTGELGTLQHVESTMVMTAPPPGDPRWSLELAGGALMDVGCYAVHAHRLLGGFAGGEPEVVGARAAAARPGAAGVDEWLDADLAFPSGATGLVRCSMVGDELDFSLRVVGSEGEAHLPDFLLVQGDDRVVVTTSSGTRTEHAGTTATYTHQLRAFTAAVRDGAPYETGADDSVATMTLIDACYRAAGLEPRPSTSAPD